MKKTYSVLILPWRGTRIRRLVLSQRSIYLSLFAGLTLLALSAWLVGDYFWLKHRAEQLRNLTVRSREEAEVLRARFRNEIQELKARHGEELATLRAQVQAQRERLLGLSDQIKTSQQLLAHWKGLRTKVKASLPPSRRSSLTGQELVEELETGISSLRGNLESLIASIPSAWPTTGWVSSGFGKRRSPWTGKKEFHAGLDIANHRGTPVYAPGDAVVEYAGKNGGTGKSIVLDHGQGITTRYGHLSKIFVHKGDRVRKHQKIGQMGNTGKSTNPHLHYEIRVSGTPIDPRRRLLKQAPPSS